MSAIASTPIDVAAQNAPTSGRLFFLDLSGGRMLSANPDGSDLKTIIDEGRKLPDGLGLDVSAGHIYWTNMGDPNRNDGAIMRSDLKRPFLRLPHWIYHWPQAAAKTEN